MLANFLKGPTMGSAALLGHSVQNPEQQLAEEVCLIFQSGIFWNQIYFLSLKVEAF